MVDLDGAKDGVRANQRRHQPARGAVRRYSCRWAAACACRAAIEVLLDAGRRARGDRQRRRAAARRRSWQWLKRFGAERICLAFDVRVDPAGEPHVHTHGWTQRSSVTLWDALAPYST